MKLKDIPWWGQLALAAAVGAILIFSQFKMGPGDFSKKQKKITGLTETLEKKQAEIRKGRQAVAKLDRLERDIASLENKLTDLRQILPTEPEMGDLLKWIKSLADQTNLDLKTFHPGARIEREFLLEQPIKMQVAGSYHQLGMFFDRISKYARIINVEGVRINPNRNRTGSRRAIQTTILSQFVAKTYIYHEDGEASGQGGGA